MASTNNPNNPNTETGTDTDTDKKRNARKNSKTYYYKHREKASQKSKEYYCKNKEKIIKRMSARVRCDICGTDIMKCAFTTHKQSQTHRFKELLLFKAQIDAIVK